MYLKIGIKFQDFKVDQKIIKKITFDDGYYKVHLIMEMFYF